MRRDDEPTGPAEDPGPAEETVPALLARQVRRRPDALAVVDGSTRLTYSQLGERAWRAATGLVAAGIEAGDRVAVWAPNSAEWIVAMLGIWSAGAVLTPLNTRYRAAEATDLLRRSGAPMLLTVGAFLGRDYPAELAGPDLPHLNGVVVLDDAVEGPAPGGARRAWGALAAGDERAGAVVERRTSELDGRSPLDLLFTSGTTGAPKGISSRHGPTLRAFRYYAETLGIGGDDRYLLVNPLFHSFGAKAGVIAALTAGAALYPVPTFDPSAAATLIARERITVFPGPPTVYHALLELPEAARAGLQSLRLAVTGAAAVPVPLLRRMADELGFDTVLTAYGLTECGGLVTMCRPGDPPDVVSATSGRAIPDVEVAIVDDDGRHLPPGEPGEVIVRGYVVMDGYLEDPAATARTIDGDGWLHTGDLGLLDDDGGLRITDRKKDMFIVGGFNAYPAEIEAALVRHPGVAQAAVIGVPDNRLGEVGHAFVVARQGHAVEPAEVLAWVSAELANFKVPRTVTLVDALPTNAGGKVVKDVLRDRLRAPQPPTPQARTPGPGAGVR